MRENVSLRELAWSAARQSAAPAATFGALIGSASDLPTLARAAASGLPALGAPGVKALLDRRDRLKEIGDNGRYHFTLDESVVGEGFARCVIPRR